MTITYPYPSHHPLAERVANAPAGTTVRRWVVRDDNHRHHHGVLRLAESPVYLDLSWKPGVRGREQRVGLFRLDLPELLRHDYIRREPGSGQEDAVRLRIHRGERGVVAIQPVADGPALPLGTVDLSE